MYLQCCCVCVVVVVVADGFLVFLSLLAPSINQPLTKFCCCCLFYFFCAFFTSFHLLWLLLLCSLWWLPGLLKTNFITNKIYIKTQKKKNNNNYSWKSFALYFCACRNTNFQRKGKNSCLTVCSWEVSQSKCQVTLFLPCNALHQRKVSEHSETPVFKCIFIFFINWHLDNCIEIWNWKLKFILSKLGKLVEILCSELKK